jgi:hypothetical protein
MSVNVGDFVGSWKINWAPGPVQEKLQAGWILIGTDSAYGDSAPELNKEFAIQVGFAILDQDGAPVLTSQQQKAAGANEPLLFLFEGSVLRWKGYFEQEPLYIDISAAEVVTPQGNRYVSIYGNTTQGDPDQVGVWGGTGSPPPPPDGAPPTLSGS